MQDFVHQQYFYIFNDSSWPKPSTCPEFSSRSILTQNRSNWISRKHGRLGQTSFYIYDFFIPQNHLFLWPPTSTIFMMFCSLMAPMPSNTPPAAEWIPILDFQLLFHDEVLEWCPATLNLGCRETNRFCGKGVRSICPKHIESYTVLEVLCI